DFGLTPADLNDPVVTSQYTDDDTGITHLYLRQRVNGLEVAYADLDVSLTAQGEVIAAGGGFVAGLADQGPAAGSPPTRAAAAGRGRPPLAGVRRRSRTRSPCRKGPPPPRRPCSPPRGSRSTPSRHGCTTCPPRTAARRSPGSSSSAPPTAGTGTT